MTVRNPQLFHSASVADLGQFIDSDEWVLEQKVDGMRCLTVIKRDLYHEATVEFFTRGGRELKSSAAKKHFDKLREALLAWARDYETFNRRKFEIVLDAELLTETGELIILDMPYLYTNDELDSQVRPHMSYFRRRLRLLGLRAGNRFPEFIRLVAAAQTIDEKVDLVNTVYEKNLEGFIAKQNGAPYSEGERVKHSLKIKLTTTADVVVMAKNSGESKHSIRGGDKINYEFGVWNGSSQLVHIGNCSGIGKEDANVGDVIEVEYLYAGAGGKLVQPRMVKIRTDKNQAECGIEQLKHVNKEAI